MIANPVWRFALKLLLWLVPCFAAWHFASAALSRPPTWIAQDFVAAYAKGLTRAIEFSGDTVAFVTTIPVREASGREGELVVEVNPRTSTYGAALFLALALASGLSFGRILLGLAILLPFQAWGIAFEFLAQLLRADAALRAHPALVGWRAEFAALGYQLGSLVFPTVAPVVTWAALHRRFIEDLARPPRRVP